MKRLLPLMATLLLVACASEAKYQEKVDAWIGAKETDLVASDWGPPQRVYDLQDGTRILTYSKTQSSGGGFPIIGIGGGFGSGGGGFISTGVGVGGGGTGGGESYCETNFTVDDGIITDVSFQGDGCAT